MDPRLSLMPLNGLRAFEAAARHLSFSHAAEELGVKAEATGTGLAELPAHLETLR